MARLSIRIDFDPSGSALGPGMAELLERVGQMGSIRKAAISMGMSYRKAWLLVNEMEATFGGPALETETGGVTGGGSTLTPLGLKLLKTFRAIEKRATQAAEADLAVLAQLVQNDAVPRKKRRSYSTTKNDD